MPHVYYGHYTTKQNQKQENKPLRRKKDMLYYYDIDDEPLIEDDEDKENSHTRPSPQFRINAYPLGRKSHSRCRSNRGYVAAGDKNLCTFIRRR